MVLIPVGFAQVNFRFTGVGLANPAECTLGLGVAGFGGTPSEAATECRDAWAGSISTEQNDDVTLVETVVKYGPTATGPTGVDSNSAQGLRTGASASSAVTWLVHKVTDSGGRAGRGRMYIPGVSEEAVGPAGEVDSGTLGTFQTELDEFFASLETALLLPVLLHGPDAPLSTPTPITSFQIDSRVATQRRRQRR